jgi:E3 ubiquitin-protein ligase UBR7
LDERVEISEDKDDSINKSTDEGNEQKSSANLSQNESTDPKGEKEKMFFNDKCFLAQEKVQSLKLSKPSTLFMLEGWREQLCKCSDCIKKYQESSLDYLLDLEDTVHHYENKTETTKTSQYEDGMKVLSEMDRSKQIDAIHGYNSMKSNLTEYLKKFAENKKVVRQEDIQEFFQKLAGNKKMRVSIPDNCK